jgi:outer membrane biosynthesis protein TonB
MSTLQFVAEKGTLCIKDFCATKEDEKQTATQCGLVVLTITHLGAPPSVEECVSQFSYLISQDTESGTS